MSSDKVKKEKFNVVIVGSGASGGWAAKILSEAGMSVAVIELGRELDPVKDFKEHKMPWDFPLRKTALSREVLENQYIQKAKITEGIESFFINDKKHPYVQNKPFHWYRGNQVGGRTLVWGRQSYRFGDLEFKSKSFDGYGENWPITYDELSPYYDYIERYIGVSGMKEGLLQLPDGKFLPPMQMSCGEQKLREVAKKKFGRTVTIGRTAVLTKPLNGRLQCHMCGPCSYGCTTNSYFFSGTTTISDAKATGKMKLFTGYIASHVNIEKNGLAKSVQCINTQTGKSVEIEGSVIVLSASTLGSTRILLNSKSALFPNGIGNTNGVLGHYLMDHVNGGGASGTIENLKGISDSYENRPNGIYIPRFRNVTSRSKEFIRGYGLQGGSRSGFKSYNHLSGFGNDLKEKMKSVEKIWGIGLKGYGECLSRESNRCWLSKSLKDEWGIPLLEISASFGDNERKLFNDMTVAAAEMLDSLGVKNIKLRKKMSVPGHSVHEIGTARMGNDPKTSFLNKWNQSHFVKNLFVTDGSAGLTHLICR